MSQTNDTATSNDQESDSATHPCHLKSLLLLHLTQKKHEQVATLVEYIFSNR